MQQPQRATTQQVIARKDDTNPVHISQTVQQGIPSRLFFLWLPAILPRCIPLRRVCHAALALMDRHSCTQRLPHVDDDFWCAVRLARSRNGFWLRSGSADRVLADGNTELDRSKASCRPAPDDPVCNLGCGAGSDDAERFHPVPRRCRDRFGIHSAAGRARGAAALCPPSTQKYDLSGPADGSVRG